MVKCAVPSCSGSRALFSLHYGRSGASFSQHSNVSAIAEATNTQIVGPTYVCQRHLDLLDVYPRVRPLTVAFVRERWGKDLDNTIIEVEHG